MEDRDPYRGIAGHYDLQHMDWYAPTYGKRLEDLFAERGLAECGVLDAGCGTGTLALRLARRGHRVTGVDLSGSLLEAAKAKAGSEAVRWIRGDITDLAIGETFDAITCVADVLNHLETIDEWERAFRSFARHLRPGGYLLLDALTRRGLERLDTYTTQDREDGALILGVIWEPAARRSTLKITSFVPFGRDGLYERASETISEWAQDVATIEERLARAGFGERERPWSDSDDPETEERLALLARLS